MRSAVRTASMLIMLGATLLGASCAKHPGPEPAAAMRPIELTEEDKAIVVAKVNGTEITNYTLLDMMSRLNAVDRQGSGTQSGEAVRSRVLDILILQELALQEAARRGMRVEDSLIDRTMEQFISKLGHEEGYREYLAKNHITAVEFRAQVERSQLVQQMLTDEVIKKANVTDDEMRNEYDRTKGEYVVPEKVSVVDIAVPFELSKEEAMKRAQGLLSALSADKDRDPAHLVSDATFGVHLVVMEKAKDPVLYEAARTLKIGELSGTIAGKEAVHILKLTGYTPARTMTYEEAKGVLTGKLRTAALIKRRQAWEQELKKDARIEILTAPTQHK